MPIMNYMLCVRTDADQTDAIMGKLVLAGAQGFEWRDQSIAASIPRHEVQLITYGTQEELTPFAELAADLAGVLSPPSVLEIETVDWAEAWKEYFKPLRISPRLAVVPSWEEVSMPSHVQIIAVDPGSAFGTGQHATTALCLRALDLLETERGIGDLADIGCGTGILGIGAHLLGAGDIVMIDNDPLAVEVARENLEHLGLVERFELTCSDVPPPNRQFQTVVANILAPVLIRLAEALCANVAPSGCLLLSGLLVSQIDEVEAPFLGFGLRRKRLSCEGEWALLWLER
jgi:ribosomal protein L11 methyltransferase